MSVINDKDRALEEASEAMVRLRALLAIEPPLTAQQQVKKAQTTLIRLKAVVALCALWLAALTLFVAIEHGPEFFQQQRHVGRWLVCGGWGVQNETKTPSEGETTCQKKTPVPK